MGWLTIQILPPMPKSNTAVRIQTIRSSSGVRCFVSDFMLPRRVSAQTTTKLTILRGTTMTFFKVLPARKGSTFSALSAAASISAALNFPGLVDPEANGWV